MFTNKTLITKSPVSAGEIIREGGVVVFPTETVYGIGASSFNHDACLSIYRIKNRPPDNPLIVHCHSIDQVTEIAHLTGKARVLLERFAPGPLSLILKKRDPRIFSTGLSTVAVRIPAHPTARALLEAANLPISAPSANLSGKPSLTRFADVVAVFDGKVEGILEGEPIEWGLESTVIDLSTPIPRLLRPGSIEKEDIESVLGAPVEIPHSPELLSPGVKYRHYSPEGQLFLVDSLETFTSVAKPPNARDSKIQEEDSPIRIAKIGFGFQPQSERELLVASNEEYAAKLYSFLVDCDHNQVTHIYCQKPKPGKLYAALMNRIQKAGAIG